jgi:hypothetical protein
MANIMTSCPTLKVPVKTGLTTEIVGVFIVLDRSAIPLPGRSEDSQVDAEGRVGGWAF